MTFWTTQYYFTILLIGYVEKKIKLFLYNPSTSYQLSIHKTWLIRYWYLITSISRQLIKAIHDVKRQSVPFPRMRSRRVNLWPKFDWLFQYTNIIIRRKMHRGQNLIGCFQYCYRHYAQWCILYSYIMGPIYHLHIYRNAAIVSGYKKRSYRKY